MHLEDNGQKEKENSINKPISFVPSFPRHTQKRGDSAYKVRGVQGTFFNNISMQNFSYKLDNLIVV